MKTAAMSIVTACLVATVSGGAARAVQAQDAKDLVAQFVDESSTSYARVAQQIWDFAELGYLETESSALLANTLAEAGFEIQSGVAGIPTAFVASWTGGPGPVVGILAEFDALPGITQDRTPERAPIETKLAGHACGHHLFGTGSVAAAIATKRWMEVSGRGGEVRVYGTPAEEGGAGKVYMVRAGLFDDVDVVLHWHPSDLNSADVAGSLANQSAQFRFSGVSSHAARAPELGRSALDGVEAMDYMVNLMREHVDEQTRIHYVITNGGLAPNVVPDFAEVFYYVRHPDPAQVKATFARVVKAAEAAALGTETTMEYEVIHGIYNVLPNLALQQAIHANLERVGGVHYDENELKFARVLRRSLPADAPPLEAAALVQPLEVNERGNGSSTDVADVSWMVATGSVNTATWVPGTMSHSWQAVAAGGMSIGEKGMIVAAKTLAMTAVDLLTDPDLVERAQTEHRERIPAGWVYEPLLGDRDPPLDYRLPSHAGAN